MKFRIIIILVIGICSCGSNQDLGYESHKNQYKEAVECLLTNYNLILYRNESKNPMDVYSSDRISNSFCAPALNLLEKNGVKIVTLYRDSTVFFYSNNSKGVKSIQHILVFSKNRKKLDEKLTSDIELKSIKNGGWYEFERVISLAN